ncbi:MAG: diguanylate cyclase [candidate division KSB1 bacterium]|nr:diguanylate cyclase [candidate division KSB1 bacterium]
MGTREYRRGSRSLHNYRYFVKTLETEINRSKRHLLPVSLVMMDIDLFKTYNDVLGHPAGNKILGSLAKLIQNNVRRIDTVARYGGEEFVLILPATAAKNAHVAAEKIRSLVQTHDFGQHVQPNQCLTISCGVATFPQDGETREQLIRTADSRLYQAKNSGRNKVVSGRHTIMIKWIRQQVKSKIFRRLFLATLAAAIIPVILTMGTWIINGISTPLYYAAVRFVLIILIAVGVAGIIATFISRNITQPISDFEHSATKIAQGNFSHTVKVHTDDEIGRLARLFNYMTLELKRLHNMNLAKIIVERNKTQTIIKNIADGVIVTDPHLNILILNHSAEKWFQIKESDVSEQPISNVIKEPKLIELLSRATDP